VNISNQELYKKFFNILKIGPNYNIRECSICGYMMFYEVNERVHDKLIVFNRACDCTGGESFWALDGDAFDNLIKTDTFKNYILDNEHLLEEGLK
jgi:hypothetical protein